MTDDRKQNFSDPEWVADRLHSAAIYLLRRLRVKDMESGIGPAQLSALSVLVFGGSKSLGELAEAEQVKPPTMSRIAAGLLRAGLVRRRPSPQDKRSIRLEATAKGTRILWEGRKRRVMTLAATLRELSGDQRRKLGEAAEMIDAIVRKM